MFPSIGPYQCEICQNITQTKQEFVDHIKDNHRDVVDEEVLQSLEKDLQKSRRKAEKEQRRKNISPAATTTSPPAKETPAQAKKATPAASKAASTPKKSHTPTAKGRKKGTLEDTEFFEVRDDGPHCKICDALVSKTSPSEMLRHQQSKQCQRTAASKNASTEAADGDVDPLDVDSSTNGVGSIVDDIIARTCQFCGKVVDNAKDLPGHHLTKGCIAKKYQMQNGPDEKGVYLKFGHFFLNFSLLLKRNWFKI